MLQKKPSMEDFRLFFLRSNVPRLELSFSSCFGVTIFCPNISGFFKFVNQNAAVFYNLRPAAIPSFQFRKLVGRRCAKTIISNAGFRTVVESQQRSPKQQLTYSLHGIQTTDIASHSERHRQLQNNPRSSEESANFS